MLFNGLDFLLEDSNWQRKIKGNIGLLCHSASVTRDLTLAPCKLIPLFNKRLTKLFGPQHGFVTDVQDNMIETKDFVHPFFKIPVFSLYGETRIPTETMLEGLDTLIIDLQDVGTRVYTYISTMGLILSACEKKDIQVVILDRPNPIGGEMVEGNILEKEFHSFVGHFEIPMRHGMTMGELALYAKKYIYKDVNLSVIPMKGWKRSSFMDENINEWINPSPNLATFSSSLTYPGTVLFEGTNISEGRGTTRALEIIGHPKIEPFSFLESIQKNLKDTDLEGFNLRPLVFFPMFQKFANTPCGGFQIHITDRQKARPWALGQFLMREFYHHLKDDFKWKPDDYEYVVDKLPMDVINGSDKPRTWIENNQSFKELLKIESKELSLFLNNRSNVLLYP